MKNVDKKKLRPRVAVKLHAVGKLHVPVLYSSKQVEFIVCLYII